MFRSALNPFCGHIEEVTLPEFQRRIKKVQKVHHYAGILRKLSPILGVFASSDFAQVETKQTTKLLSSYGYDRAKDNLSVDDVTMATCLAFQSLLDDLGDAETIAKAQSVSRSLDDADLLSEESMPSCG